MCRLCISLVAFLTFLTVLQAQNDVGPRPEEAKLQTGPVEKIVPVGQLIGKVETLGEDGALKLRVTYHVLEPNLEAQANYLRERQQLMARQQAALMNPNPAQRYQEMTRVVQDAMKLQGQQHNFFHVRDKQQDIKLKLADDVKLRVPAPPIAFDGEGRARRYTPEELKELKGPEGLPGFPADAEDLATGKTVLVLLARKLRFKPDGKELEKDQPAMSEKPLVTIVLIGNELGK